MGFSAGLNNCTSRIARCLMSIFFFIGGHQDQAFYGSDPKKAEILSFDGETWKEIAKMSSGRKSSAVTQVVAEDYKQFCN